MQEQYQTNLVHLLAFRERERLSREASQSLAQGTVPALHVSGLAALLTHWSVSILREDLPVALPKVAVERPLSVAFGNTPPKLPTGLLAPVTDGVGHDLAGTPT